MPWLPAASSLVTSLKTILLMRCPGVRGVVLPKVHAPEPLDAYPEALLMRMIDGLLFRRFLDRIRPGDLDAERRRQRMVGQFIRVLAEVEGPEARP